MSKQNTIDYLLLTWLRGHQQQATCRANEGECIKQFTTEEVEKYL
ncbi:hypothetical protein [Alkaliphilus metalliredigens]|nr:hypothetical protein [Alkaliphilus metalliredigens]